MVPKYSPHIYNTLFKLTSTAAGVFGAPKEFVKLYPIKTNLVPKRLRVKFTVRVEIDTAIGALVDQLAQDSFAIVFLGQEFMVST